MSIEKLKNFFLAHHIAVRTCQPIKQVLFRLDIVRKMTKWMSELSIFDISVYGKGRIGQKVKTILFFVSI